MVRKEDKNSFAKLRETRRRLGATRMIQRTMRDALFRRAIERRIRTRRRDRFGRALPRINTNRSATVGDAVEFLGRMRIRRPDDYDSDEEKK